MIDWLNQAVLPRLAQTERKDGLYAEFDPHGQLHHLGFYEDGSCAACWALYLESGVEEGKALMELGSGGTPDSELYRVGTAERFDAWSTNSKPQRIAYRKWVCGWIKNVTDYAERRVAQTQDAAQARARIAKDGKRAVIKSVKT